MPCENLDRLDRRYRKRYNMSMVENLKDLKEKGMKKFLRVQEKKYGCPECGDVISVHDGKCYACGHIEPG
jgi:rubrerythrin